MEKKKVVLMLSKAFPKREGMPYRSKQIEIARFDKISIQPLIIGDAESWKEDVCQVWDNESQRFKMSKLSEAAQNDGLPFDVFKEWFLPYDNSQTMAIVHFTEFKY